MNYITLNKSFMNLNPIFNGTEANLYDLNESLYKIYFKRNSTSMMHLIILNLRQKEIKNTIFPDAVLIDEEGLVGCSIKHFKDYVPINIKKDKSNKEKLSILKNTLNKLKELTDNYIYPTDINSEGIITNDIDVQIIDLDTYSTKISDKKDDETLKFVLTLYKNIIFELMFLDFDLFEIYEHFDSYLENKNINKQLINDLKKQNINYNSIYNLISYFEDDNVISQQLHK